MMCSGWYSTNEMLIKEAASVCNLTPSLCLEAYLDSGGPHSMGALNLAIFIDDFWTGHTNCSRIP